MCNDERFSKDWWLQASDDERRMKVLEKAVMGLWCCSRDVNIPFVDSVYLSRLATSTRPVQPPIFNLFQIVIANNI